MRRHGPFSACSSDIRFELTDQVQTVKKLQLL